MTEADNTDPPGSDGSNSLGPEIPQQPAPNAQSKPSLEELMLKYGIKEAKLLPEIEKWEYEDGALALYCSGIEGDRIKTQQDAMASSTGGIIAPGKESSEMTQQSIELPDGQRLYLVADGMSRAEGDVPKYAEQVVTLALQRLSGLIAENKPIGQNEILEILSNINNELKADPEIAASASTLSGVIIGPGNTAGTRIAKIFSLGDSPCFVIRQDKVEMPLPLANGNFVHTIDLALIGSPLTGELSAEDFFTPHLYSSSLIAHMGRDGLDKSSKPLQYTEVELLAGDHLLLMSDGVLNSALPLPYQGGRQNSRNEEFYNLCDELDKKFAGLKMPLKGQLMLAELFERKLKGAGNEIKLDKDTLVKLFFSQEVLEFVQDNASLFVIPV